MRNQLQKFTDLANTLLPHETKYLLSIQQFVDSQRLEILQLVDYNARHIDQFTPYDTSIDKRKYNHLQLWITDRLKAIDVDEHLHWMLDMEEKIMTDSIRLEEEKELLQAIHHYRHPAFFFTKFYELVERYRHFLLIRLSYDDHQLADTFIKTYRDDYVKARQINENLHGVTLDIVGQYAGNKAESSQWIKWLSSIFYDERIDGLNRYLALVRLVFISHNYRKYDLLREKLDYLDEKFTKGISYSKRILLNYSSSRLMLHSHFREYDQAVYFGYLSVRAQNHDYLFYVNNLCAVLLRLKRVQEALQLMQKASSFAKKTKNLHTRVGYVAYYMESLNKNGMFKNALGYGDAFLKAYSREILHYRWHLFFTVYLESLMHLGLFDRLIKTARKYKLPELDKPLRNTAGYLPMIPLYVEAARYREGITKSEVFIKIVDGFWEEYRDDEDRSSNFQKLMQKIKTWVPELASSLVKRDSKKGKGKVRR